MDKSVASTSENDHQFSQFIQYVPNDHQFLVTYWQTLQYCQGQWRNYIRDVTHNTGVHTKKNPAVSDIPSWLKDMKIYLKLKIMCEFWIQSILT